MPAKTPPDFILEIEAGFAKHGIPTELTDRLVETFLEAKRRFHLGDLRPNEVEGGRFAEAAFRILEHEVFGSHTPVGTTLTKVPQLVQKLGSSPATAGDSLRIHIPRNLQAIYDIRNKRDVAHLGAIDANLQDATLVVCILDWVFAEFVRIFHSVSSIEAEELIRKIVTREVPAIQMFGDFPKVLKSLSTPNTVLTLLYWKNSEGATRQQLFDWVAGSASGTSANVRQNVNRSITTLAKKNMIHDSGEVLYVTRRGEREVESKGLVDPI
ncbi:hypothetical protein GS467_13850 [Rhodococcus hoagii]|nr:hypothetical protein [Prescottella equi]